MTTLKTRLATGAEARGAGAPWLTVDLHLPDVRTVLSAGALLGLFVALFSLVQFATPALAGNDGYYHSKMGYLVRQEGLTPSFDVLPMTILNAEEFYDHHMLYHAYLALFATVDPAVDGGLALTRGAKFASVLMPSLAFLAVWWLLRSQRVAGAAIWALALFAVSEAFLYRMSMARAQSTSLLFLVLGLHWLLSRRYWLLFPLAFAYVWTYNAFPLLLVMAGLYVAVTLLQERRLAWKALLFPLLGTAAGLLVNPYFPENLLFIFRHLAPKLGESATRVGNEWSPYRTETLLGNSGLALATLVLGTLALGWAKSRIDKRTALAYGLAILFAYMLFRSRRFVEYFPPFALIFLAFSATPLIQEIRKRWALRLPANVVLPAVALLLLAYPLANSVGDARASMEGSKAADRYADAALWLRETAPAGATIFQTDWDDFTRLFFYNSNSIYTAGLDPTFMELYDAELFDEWVQITRGQVEQPGAAIRDRFGASFVFSDLKHTNFMEQAAADPDLEELYRDDYAVIYAVSPAP